MKKRSLLIVVGVFIAAVIFFITKVNKSSAETGEIFATVQRGEFRSEIIASGELFAKSSVQIRGPGGMQSAGIFQTKIEHIIEEGTVVNKGDYVARLDQTELGTRRQQRMSDYTVSTSQYTQAKLDSAIELRKARDAMDKLLFDIEKKKLVLENSEFEPPAVVKEKQMDLDRAEKQYQQEQENYELQRQKSVAKMKEAEAKMNDDKAKLDALLELQKQFTIMASEPGMLIYRRDWRGNKLGVGAQVSAWDPVVATLPDLTKMVSKTYINEVDINNVKKGQKVDIGLDAFPDKRLTGLVIDVANMGQQRPNSDSKVFEISVQVHESDTTLRPGMTTSNKIIAEVLSDVIFIPVEAIHSQGDSITYVLTKDGSSTVRQEVLLGKSNSDEVVVLNGLDEGSMIYLSDPDGMESKPLRLINNGSKAIAKKD
ncbi:efflux RND transporter periplasmic adaptor subunit [Roseivirga sp. E12]|uniref:efflux RND transporter periplasmic adaptor subunit n=1 Tax=Roseivirga sp. E12 TaxID=2819237 RepID=UPI001ABC62A0|nr:HlyD family secretion protein [Roseivirga sp. E12]MBO3697711.1 HlyD family efflux transporter periplasmic adaptor subunit [Roseivirga sp. E12]